VLIIVRAIPTMYRKTINLLVSALVIPMIAIAVVASNSCKQESKPVAEDSKTLAPAPEIPQGYDYIDLAAGCFWCVETIYQRIDGIHSATAGYMGGHIENPTYEDIGTGNSGHAQIVRVVFNPDEITTTKILEWFWKIHDPTMLDRQGNDVGPQYRSVIFYHSEEQKQIAQASMQRAQSELKKNIVTEITKASAFYGAEIYHQDYYSKHGNSNPYSALNIPPKLKKLGLKNKKERVNPSHTL